VGLKAKALMASGALVGDEIVIAISRERLVEADCEKGFILDGFPRTSGQAEALDALLRDLGTPLDCCVAITLDPEELVQRLLKRGKLEGRPDDNEEAIRKRMLVYERQTAPLVDHYRGLGLLREVPGLGSVEDVATRIAEVLA
jgi:adenylate kinase